MANDINTTSLDLPPALASILNMQLPTVQPPAQAAPMAGLSSAAGIGPQQIGGGMPMGIPSFQEGGYIGEIGRRVGENIRQNPVQLIPGSGYATAARNLVNLGRQLKQQYGQPEPKTGFEKYFPEAGKGGYSMGRIDKAIEYPAIDDPEQDALDRQYNEMLNARSSTGRAASGVGLTGLGAQRGLSGAMGGLDETRKKPTITIEEIPSFQEGGMIGEGGMPIAPGVVPGMPMAGVNPAMDSETPMDAQAMQMQINQVASRHPEAMAEIRNAIVEEMQSGDLTQQELNMIVQLAQLAANNPEMYPYVKQFAMQQGIAAAGDLPEQYDQGLVMVLLLAARAVQQDLGGAPAGEMPANAGPAIPSMQKGGMLPASGKSEPILIEAHTGEYVIPKHVVDMKGKEFFDSLVEKYKDKK